MAKYNKKEEGEKKVRVWTYLRPEVMDEVYKLADEVGMDRSQFTALSLEVGAKRVAESMKKLKEV